MTDHLPECGRYCDGKPPKCRGGDCTLCDEVDCICAALRACEQRVYGEATEEMMRGTIRLENKRIRDEGYAAGVQAARDEDQRILIKYGAEQFVRGEQIGKAMGYAAGVQAARDAVVEAYNEDGFLSISHYLRAIEALREGK